MLGQRSLEMQVPLLLAIEGSPGVMARGKLNDMMTKRFQVPHDPCLGTSNTEHAAFWASGHGIVVRRPVQGNALEIDRAIPQMWSCARSGYDGSYKKK
jgi:hypothetical protein